MIFPRVKQTAHDVARHYDELDTFYREIWGDHLHHGLWSTGRESVWEAVAALVDRVAEEARVGPGARVCDIGCGYGATARQLTETRGARVVGLTVSKKQYAHASRSSGRDGPRFILGDWLRNDFPDESFDAILAVESLAHMTDKPLFFREAARTLRSEGRLVLCPWMAAENPRPWQVRWVLEPICREGRVPSLGSASEYRAMLERAGLRFVRAEDWTRRVAKTWPMVARRFARESLRRPGYLRHLVDPKFPERVFAVAVLRMILAFRTGAFRYGILVGEKPGRITSESGASKREGPSAWDV